MSLVEVEGLELGVDEPQYERDRVTQEGYRIHSRVHPEFDVVVPARSFVVHPDYVYDGGWEEVTIPLPGLDPPAPEEVQALIYYPSPSPQPWGLEGAPIARDAVFKSVAFAHGWWPGQEIELEPDLSWAFCSGPSPAANRLFTLFRSTQRALAMAGFVSIAPDLRWQVARDDPEVAAPALRMAIDWLHNEWRFRDSIDQRSVGLAGHSFGGWTVHALADDAEMRAAVGAVALLEPAFFGAEGYTFNQPTLWLAPAEGIFSFEGGPEELPPFSGPYDNSATPKFRLVFDSLGHWTYYDGMCAGDDLGPIEVPAWLAETQRAQTKRVLPRFFRRYLLGEDVPDDLGLRDNWALIAEFCLDLGDGERCLWPPP